MPAPVIDQAFALIRADQGIVRTGRGVDREVR